MKSSSGNTLNQSDEHATLPDPLIGTTLADHLEIISRAGQGGMSVVYKAKDLLLNRLVAVKVLLPHVAINPRGIRRFRREALAVSKLDHPNIIRVHEFQLPDDGQPFLVMDLLEGQSLDEFINRKGPMESRRAITLITQVCWGLEHAHNYGVVHRDLKPGNIMLLKDESKRQVAKIVDFGLAKLVQEENDSLDSLTRTGDIFGSPLYMSPEQCKGQSLDNRSDIYSLGCVMYEILTGLPPLKGKTVLDTIQMQISQYPEPLVNSNHRIVMARRLDPILLKAMAKDPVQRYQTVAEFRTALQEVKESADDNGFLNKLQLPLQMRQSVSRSGIRAGKKTFIMLAVCTILVLVAAVMLAINSKNTAQVGPITIAETEAKSAWYSLDWEGQKYFDAGDFADAEQDFAKQLTVAQKLPAEYKQAVLENLVDLYCATDRSPKQEWAKELEVLNATIFDTTGVTTNLLNASSAKAAKIAVQQAIDLAQKLHRAGNPDSAQRLLDEALKVSHRCLDGNDLTLAACLEEKALIISVEDKARATREREKSPVNAEELSLRKQLISIYQSRKDSSLALARAYANLGAYYLRSHQTEDAKINLDKALAMLPSVPGHEAELAQCAYDRGLCDYHAWGDQHNSATPKYFLHAGQMLGEPKYNWTYDDYELRANIAMMAAEQQIASGGTNTIKMAAQISSFRLGALMAASNCPSKFYVHILQSEHTLAQNETFRSRPLFLSAMARARRCLAIGERLKQPPETQTPNRVIIAWIYYKLHKFEKSAEYFNQVMNSGNTEYYSYLARAVLEIGKKTEGLKWAEKGLEHDKQLLNGSQTSKQSDLDPVVLKRKVAQLKDIALARAELIVGMAYFENGKVSQAQAVVDEANKLLSGYSEETLGQSDYVIRELFRDALEIRNELRHCSTSLPDHHPH